jgi:hypothetical protein
MPTENQWLNALHEHLEHREWSGVQIVNLTHKIGRSALLSCEAVLEVLEYQQEIDEYIQAQKDHDKAFSKHDPTVYEKYQQPTLAHDSEGNYITTEGWDVA